MKIWIEQKEVYPFYKVYYFPDDTNANVDIDTLKRWKKINDEFIKVQHEIAQANGFDIKNDYSSCTMFSPEVSAALGIDEDEKMTQEEKCANYFGLSFHVDKFNYLVEHRGWKSENRPAEEYELEMWYALLNFIPEGESKDD